MITRLRTCNGKVDHIKSEYERKINERNLQRIELHKWNFLLVPEGRWRSLMLINTMAYSILRKDELYDISEGR